MERSTEEGDEAAVIFTRTDGMQVQSVSASSEVFDATGSQCVEDVKPRHSNGTKGKMPLKRKNASSEEGTHGMNAQPEESGNGGDCEDDVDSLQKKVSVLCKDDGDIELYLKRLHDHSLLRAEVGAITDKDFTFAGGLRVPGHLWSRLYKYQKTGVKWLWELHCQRVGGILGDEMGLGKTIQVVAFLAALSASGLQDKAPPRHRGLGPVIVVCPATVMHHWVKEFHAWWPVLRVAILHSSGTFAGSGEALVHGVFGSPGVLVTSYATFLRQQDLVLMHSWHYAILDEGHFIRNPDAQITVAVKRLRTCHRLILSGSPIQNNLKELWSLFDFAFPGRLGTLPDFTEHFSVPITQGGYSNATQVQVLTAFKCATVLRDTISPYLVRRMKADLNKTQLHLPDKSEQVLFCRLTPEQRAVYTEYISSPEACEILSGRLIAFPGLIKLRKICNHPDLTTGALRTNYSDTAARGRKPKVREAAYGYWKRSGKMIVVRSLLKLWKRQGHKVLLFTQSKQMLDILESFMLDRGYEHRRMDGDTNIGSRQHLIDDFNTDPSIFVFLLTTRVGGLGVNLVGANRVIIFDPDWNPSTDTQARERAWRIGQGRQVTIYRLLTTGTVEEKIYQRQIFKQFLTNRILANPKQRRFFNSNDLLDLFSLADDTTHETETSAIFAGTGSLIDLAKIKVKADSIRQDAKEKRKHQSELADQRRQEMLREMAKKLSRKIELSKKATEEATSVDGGPSAADLGVQATGTPSNAEGGSLAAESGTPVQDGCTAAEGEGSAETITEKESCDISRALLTETRTIMAGGLFGNVGDLEFESHVDDRSVEPALVSDVTGDRLTSLPGAVSGKSQNSDTQLMKRQKAKRSHTDPSVKVEGSAIPNLTRREKYRSDAPAVANGDNVAAASNDGGNGDGLIDDEYILSRLLKKNLVQAALKHDVVVDACNADYAIVEAEAEKVAKQAAHFLRLSRRQCHTRRSIDVPTWTGSAASVGGVRQEKPRFGKKQAAVKTVVGATVSAVFTGSELSGSSNAESSQTSGAPPSSSHLLQTMMQRNSLLTEDNGAEQQASGSSTAADAAGLAAFMSSADPFLVLGRDLRDFIATRVNSSENDYVTTTDILDEFAQRVGQRWNSKFKALLQEICVLEKMAGDGRWRLKPQYR